jgi:hypothetical protein
MMTKSPGVDENKMAVEGVHLRFCPGAASAPFVGKTGIVDGHTIVNANSSFCQSLGGLAGSAIGILFEAGFAI